MLLRPSSVLARLFIWRFPKGGSPGRIVCPIRALSSGCLSECCTVEYRRYLPLAGAVPGTPCHRVKESVRATRPSPSSVRLKDLPITAAADTPASRAASSPGWEVSRGLQKSRASRLRDLRPQRSFRLRDCGVGGAGRALKPQLTNTDPEHGLRTHRRPPGGLRTGHIVTPLEEGLRTHRRPSEDLRTQTPLWRKV